MNERNQGPIITTGAVLSITAVCVAIIAFFLFGVPRYKVWQQEMKGRAELAQAEQNRQIKIEEAKANLEAKGGEQRIMAAYIFERLVEESANRFFIPSIFTFSQLIYYKVILVVLWYTIIIQHKKRNCLTR